MIQPTSLTALADVVAAGRAGHQERVLLKLWLEHPIEGLTDREAERLSNIRSNAVSARRNGLIVRWAIEKLPIQLVSQERKCRVTGRTVKAWKVVQGTAAQQEFWG